MVSNKKS